MPLMFVAIFGGRDHLRGNAFEASFSCMPVPTLEDRLAARVRPQRAWVMEQTWTNLLFLHWRVPADIVQATLPGGLTVDTFDGVAWAGVVPFFMRRVHPRWLPSMPGGLSNFLELNVRTYVYDAAGRPGVWFYSLDCNQSIAVKIARKFFHLPYEHALMSATRTEAGTIHYEAKRRGREETADFSYRPADIGADVKPGSLEFFLIERYLLFAYARDSRRLWSGRVWHPPYRVAPTTASTWSDLPVRQAGFITNGRPPDHQCTAAPVTVKVFGLEAVH